MFSAGGIARGAGANLPIRSPLRPRAVRPRLLAAPVGGNFLFDRAFDDPLEIANVRAYVTALPNLVLGAGGTPPLAAAGAAVAVPIADTAA